MSSELARRAVHLSMGGFALLLRWLTPLAALAAAGVALVFNALLLHRLTRRVLLRDPERRHGFSWGILLYPASVMGLLVAFRSRLELAAAAWGILAFGDAMAGIVGSLLGGPRLAWNPRKTWSGFAACTLWGAAAAAFLLRWTQRAALDPGGTSPPTWIGGSFLDDGAAGALIGPGALLACGCLAAALLAAVAESLDTRIDDNLLVPLAAGTGLALAASVEPLRLAAAGDVLAGGLVWGAVINALLAVAALAARSVRWSGAVVGWLLGTALATFGGWPAFLMLVLFFVLGTAATKIGFARKAAAGLAQERGGRRGAANAWANAGAATAFAFLARATAERDLWSVALAGAFATAACDTVATEIGQAFGRRHHLVTTWRRVPAGTSGAVSLEGTAAGLLAAVIVAAGAAAAGLIAPRTVPVVAVAALGGALAESALGASLERRLGLSNDVVNFANTLAGAGLAVGLWALVQTR